MPDVYKPNLDEFRELAAGDINLIPVYREFAADLETPVSVYLKLMDEMNPSFLLESVENGTQLGRYSFIGVNPRGMITLHGRTVTDKRHNHEKTFELPEGQDILDVIKEDLERFHPADVPNLPILRGGAVGYLGYDVVRDFERLPNTATAVHTIPDAVFLLADTFVVFDHVRHILMVIANARVMSNGKPPDIAAAYVNAIQEIERVAEKLLRPLPAVPRKRRRQRQPIDRAPKSNKGQHDYEKMVAAAKEYIAAGDIFQVVLSQRFERQTTAHPFTIYRALRMLNPSPYMFYFDFGELDFQVVGASPEIHVRLEDRTAQLRPIAGTRKRGQSPEEDLALEKELLADPKER
ncbi:MAG: chorismate-binding protein, partial [Anaerolineales bacterium]|nr:chorismate-binding protein [Anaerolineales bacterium]